MLHNHQNSLSVYLSRFCSISFTRFSPFRLLSSTVYSSLETFSFRLFVCCLVSSCWQLAPHIIIMTLFKIFDLKKRERREKWKTASRANKIHTNLLGYAQQLTTTTKTLSMETKWNEEKNISRIVFWAGLVFTTMDGIPCWTRLQFVRGCVCKRVHMVDTDFEKKT